MAISLLKYQTFTPEMIAAADGVQGALNMFHGAIHAASHAGLSISVEVTSAGLELEIGVAEPNAEENHDGHKHV